MGQAICKLEGVYFEFSSVVDAPVTYPLVLLEFKEYYRDEYGRQGFEELESRLERVEAKGTSSRLHENVEAVLKFNRAGRNGTRLPLDVFRAWARREILDLTDVEGSDPNLNDDEDSDPNLNDDED
jgi:hypothetical protein